MLCLYIFLLSPLPFLTKCEYAPEYAQFITLFIKNSVFLQKNQLKKP